MINVFKNVTKQIRFTQAFNHAADLVREGKKEEAFNAFGKLLIDRPSNPYLRHNLLVLGRELNKDVHLPNDLLNEQHANSESSNNKQHINDLPRLR